MRTSQNYFRRRTITSNNDNNTPYGLEQANHKGLCLVCTEAFPCREIMPLQKPDMKLF
jgi:hypothetical protein